ncbi:MAG: hypothetical protein Q7S33_00925 [Nanoarchaeota archaeon]|nr:hypothetical protein [Nanoarchaeota archaeon]
MKFKLRKIENKKAQVWVETVIYTLIGLTIIALLLGYAKPKIDSMKDKFIIDQTIDLMNKVDLKITETKLGAEGNKRIIPELKISKGKLSVYGAYSLSNLNDAIVWSLDSKYKYSEPGAEISVGNLKVKTTGTGPWTVTLNLTYSDVNLSYNGKDEAYDINSAPTPYSLTIENLGTSSGGLKKNIDLRI